MVLLVQKGLPTNKKSKDPVLVCSMRLRVSAGLQESWRSRIQAGEVMGLLVRARASRQRANLLSSGSFIQAASMAQIKSGSSLLKDPD